jgi:hypothetical protein
MMAAVNTVNGRETLKRESDFLSKFATVSVTRKNTYFMDIYDVRLVVDLRPAALTTTKK